MILSLQPVHVVDHFAVEVGVVVQLWLQTGTDGPAQHIGLSKPPPPPPPPPPLLVRSSILIMAPSLLWLEELAGIIWPGSITEPPLLN